MADKGWEADNEQSEREAQVVRKGCREEEEKKQQVVPSTDWNRLFQPRGMWPCGRC
jgi:hypothetical protein